MDEPGGHHSQQMDTRTENEIPHVLTHRWVLNNGNIWTLRGEYHTLGSVGGGGLGEGQWDGGWGGIMWGGMSGIGDGGWRQQTTLPCVYLCNYLACSAHVPQNLKFNKKNKEIIDISLHNFNKMRVLYECKIC